MFITKQPHLPNGNVIQQGTGNIRSMQEKRVLETILIRNQKT
jgi:hypothetical protein